MNFIFAIYICLWANLFIFVLGSLLKMRLGMFQTSEKSIVSDDMALTLTLTQTAIHNFDAFFVLGAFVSSSLIKLRNDQIKNMPIFYNMAQTPFLTFNIVQLAVV